MPGWTDILLTHFLSGGAEGPRTGDPLPFLFVSPGLYGGYAFYRRLALDLAGETGPPPGAPAGLWRRNAEGNRVGIPGGRGAWRYRLLESTFGKMGAVGTEFFAAFLYWMKDGIRADQGAPAAVAGVHLPDASGGRTVTVTDPDGRLSAETLASMAVRLVKARARNEKGLLSPAALVGKKEAEELAASIGAAITVAKTNPG
jgi:hypothetical protein